MHFTSNFMEFPSKLNVKCIDFDISLTKLLEIYALRNLCKLLAGPPAQLLGHEWAPGVGPEPPQRTAQQ